MFSEQVTKLSPYPLDFLGEAKAQRDTDSPEEQGSALEFLKQCSTSKQRHPAGLGGDPGAGMVIRRAQLEAWGRDRVQTPREEGGVWGPLAGWGLGAKST